MKLFYRRFGYGQKHLVILHGLFGMSDNWVSLGKKFSEYFTVIIPDLPNHGSSPAMKEFSFENITIALNELFDEIGVDHLYFLGHSLGGKIAAYYSLHGKTPIEKLIIADISLREYPLNNEHKSVISAIKSIDLSKIRSIKDAEMEIRKHIIHEKLVLFVLKNIKRTDAGSYHWKLNLPNIKSNLHHISGKINFDSKFESPCLILKGENSSYITMQDEKDLALVFPNSHVKTVDRAGHWLHADNPDDFYRIVIQFLK